MSAHGEIFRKTLNLVKPGFILSPIPESGTYGKPVTPSPDKCPWCNSDVPEDDDAKGEGPVYWTVSDEPYCSMECVIAQHRKWLKEQEKRDEASLPPGGRKREFDWGSVYRRL